MVASALIEVGMSGASRQDDHVLSCRAQIGVAAGRPRLQLDERVCGPGNLACTRANAFAPRTNAFAPRRERCSMECQPVARG